MRHRQRDDADIGRAGQHLVHDVLGRFAAQLIVRRMRVVGQRGERGRHERGRERRRGRDAHGFGGFVAERARPRLDRTQADQRAFDFLVQQERAARRRDARTMPVEQRVAEIGLEFLDLPRDGRLRAAEQFARAGHAAGRHDRGKSFELMQLHDAFR